jgi:hypothetical protein
MKVAEDSRDVPNRQMSKAEEVGCPDFQSNGNSNLDELNRSIKHRSNR